MATLYDYPLNRASWNLRDVLLFANTIGCQPDELDYVYELDPSFKAFPTYPILLTFKHDYLSTSNFAEHFRKHLTPPKGFVAGFPELDIRRVVDGERGLKILKDIPPTSANRDFRIRSSVVGVWDKGPSKSTVVKTEHVVFELVEKEEIVFTRMWEVSVFMGQGGWGGPNESGPSSPPSAPRKPPTATHTHHIPINAHLLYRLNGDYNPLHATSVAAAVVQPTPIMHGLYSWNVAAHAVLEKLRGAKLRSFQARFKIPVRPGDILETDMWDCENGQVRFVMRVKGKIVLNKGVAMLVGASKGSKL